MAITLAIAQANVTALSSAAANGGTEEVTITTDAGTRRIKYRSTDDLFRALGYWRREVNRLTAAAAGRPYGASLAKFYD